MKYIKRHLKKEGQRTHAKKRALERYNLELNQDSYNELSEKAKQATVIKRTSHRVTIREIVHNGEMMKVVYDSKRHQIVTFLPL